MPWAIAVCRRRISSAGPTWKTTACSTCPAAAEPDADGNVGHGAINITEPVIACLESALTGLPPIPAPEAFFADDAAVGNLIEATVAACAGEGLAAVTKEEALANLNSGMMAGNLMKRNVSKNPGMKSDKAQIEILPVYVPAMKSDGSLTEVSYYDADGEFLESRNVAKPLVVTYVESKTPAQWTCSSPFRATTATPGSARTSPGPPTNPPCSAIRAPPGSPR
jgi:hypothetical protein